MGSVDNSRGLELQFKQLPPLSESPIPFSVSSDPHKRLRLSEEVSVLLQKAAIEQVPTSSLGPGLYSRLFLVPQEKGGNETSYRSFYFEYLPCGPHFKMETNRSIREIPSLRVGQQNFSGFLSSSAHTFYPDSFLPGRFSYQGTQPRYSFVS